MQENNIKTEKTEYNFEDTCISCNENCLCDKFPTQWYIGKITGTDEIRTGTYVQQSTSYGNFVPLTISMCSKCAWEKWRRTSHQSIALIIIIIFMISIFGVILYPDAKQNWEHPYYFTISWIILYVPFIYFIYYFKKQIYRKDLLLKGLPILSRKYAVEKMESIGYSKLLFPSEYQALIQQSEFKNKMINRFYKNSSK